MSTSCKIYMGNLPWRYESDDLARMLWDMGYDFASAIIAKDRETGKSRGFAFVEFKTLQAAQEAVGNLNGHVVDGRTLRVAPANEKPRPGRGGGHRRESSQQGYEDPLARATDRALRVRIQRDWGGTGVDASGKRAIELAKQHATEIAYDGGVDWED